MGYSSIEVGIEAQAELHWWDMQGALRSLEWVVGEHEMMAGDIHIHHLGLMGLRNQKC